MSEKNLTPYFLAIGPLLLVGAYMNWPAADVIGNRGMQSLADASDTLMPLLIVATLGTLMVLGGLYLLIGEMMHNAIGLNKQLLSLASVLVALTMAFFIVGMGSNVSVINAEDAKVDEADESFAFESEEDKGDFAPMEGEYGDLIQWNGANLSHGNKLNETNQTRISFDFRVLSKKIYDTSTPKNSKSKNKSFTIGDYYDTFK